MRVVALVPAALALAVAAGSAGAASIPAAWQTFIRAGEFTALLADDDQVWGATADAGLARWDRAAARFEIIRRQPGAIASNHLTAIARDRSARLWVATDGAGVSRRSADGRRWNDARLRAVERTPGVGLPAR
jgi:ligand-binding sensor domain-containing protein